MTSLDYRHYQVAPDYRVQVKPTPEQIRRAARVWFNRRKLRQRTRQVMDFMSLPHYVTLKYKLR